MIELWSRPKTYAPFCPSFALGLLLSFLAASSSVGPAAIAGDFADLTGSFGDTEVIMGTHHPSTTNPDGTGIDFWTPEMEGAAAKDASFSNPHIAGADAYGNIYVADKASHAILRITPDRRVHTFAGTHAPGFNGDGPAPATSLQITSPNGLYVLPDGTVYLLDPGNHRIRRVDRRGVMTTVVLDPEPRWASSGRALWISPDETLIYYTHEFLPVPPRIIADGAAVKQWTPSRGIETVCSKAVGFRNPANIAVNPVDGKLYVTDRAEEDPSKTACGVFRVDGPDRRTRITGIPSQPKAASGRPVSGSFIDQPRGIAFLADGSYFLCAHKDGNVWYVDAAGILHLYIQGSGKGDTFVIGDGQHPPLDVGNVISQPRAVTLAPSGALLLVSNDSGYLVMVPNVVPPSPVRDLAVSYDPSRGAMLRWSSSPGTGYRIERTQDPAAQRWDPIGAIAGKSRATATEATDPGATLLPWSFYRVLPPL